MKIKKPIAKLKPNEGAMYAERKQPRVRKPKTKRKGCSK